MLPDRFRRKGEQPERSPAERMGEEDDEGDGHEQNGAKPEPALPREPQPEAEGKKGQRHRQGEIDEAVKERVIVDEEQRKDRRGRKPVVNLARDQQESRDGQNRDRHDDQLDGCFETEDRPKKLHKSIDAEIADRRPVIFVVALKIRGTRDVQLYPIPADMPEQIHQGCDARVEQRHDREQHQQQHERARFPPPAGSRWRRLDGSMKCERAHTGSSSRPPVAKGVPSSGRVRFVHAALRVQRRYSFNSLIKRDYLRGGSSMKKLLIGGAALLVSAAAIAQVAPAPVAASQTKAAKVHTRAEVQAKVTEHFARLDTNRDGAVTKAEADGRTHGAPRPVRRAPRGPARAGVRADRRQPRRCDQPR